MRWGRIRLLVICTIVSGWSDQECDAASCVWKVTSSKGGTLYLGGSIHALRRSDYPLPAAFNRA